MTDRLIFIRENNNLGATVTTLIAEEGVMATITSQNPEGLFSLNGYDLIADTVLDFEVNSVYLMKSLVLCSANKL